MAIRPEQMQDLISARPLWVRLLVPFVLGAFIATGHEAFMSGLWPVFAGLALAALAMPARPKPATLYGWSLGLGYFALTLRWIIEPFLVDPLRHGWMAPFAIFLMAGGLALFWAMAFGMARWLAGPSRRALLLLPFALTAAELLRGHILSGFPWGLLSYATVGGVADIWLAWIGPYGTSFLLVCVSSLAAYGLQRRTFWVWPTVASAALATFCLNTITPAAPAPTDKTVRLIQPNAPQHQKWDPDWMPVFFDRAIDLTMVDDPVDVVIWPETSVPAVLNTAEPWLEYIARAARGAPVVAGINRFEGDDLHNSLIVIEGEGAVAGLYDKSHLVPFGEYIPMAWLLEPLGLGVIVEQVAGFVPGTGPDLLQIHGLGLARVLICYEGIFPEDMQRGEVRPDILLIITNDAWFGNGPGPYQHLVQAQARAIEQGLPVLRAANTGISAVIDARGKVISQLGLNQAGHLDAAVPAPLPPTLYARLGDWPLVVLLILAFVRAVVARNRFAVDADGSEV